MAKINKVTLKNGQVRYRVTVEVTDQASGERRQKRLTFRTKQLAEDHVAAVRTDRARGVYTVPTAITVNEHLDAWLLGKRDVRASTKEGYRTALLHVRDAFGAKQIQRVAKKDIDELVNTMEAKELTPRTIELTLTVVGMAFEAAMREGTLAKNCVKLVKKPRAAAAKRFQVWDGPQIAAFLAHVADNRLAGCWALTMTGLRRSEVTGVRWSDITLDGPTPSVSIKESHVALKGGERSKGAPKSQRSLRDVPLDAWQVNMLKTTRRAQVAERLAAGEAYSNVDDYICVDELGNPIHPDTYSHWFQDLGKAAGLPRLHLHGARHSVATILLREGQPVHSVAAILGHDPAVLLRTYAHVIPSDLGVTMRSLSAAVGMST